MQVMCYGCGGKPFKAVLLYLGMLAGFLQLFTILHFGIVPCWVKLLKTVKKLLYTG